MNEFSAKLSGGRGIIRLGDLDISNSVRGFEMRAGADQITQVTLELAVIEMDAAEETVRLFIRDDVRRLLIKLGWTPPADAVS